MKKCSFIGISLVAVASVAAAFVPSSRKKDGVVLNGKIINRISDGTDFIFSITCTEFGVGGDCSYTETGAEDCFFSATGLNTDTSCTGNYTGYGTTLNEEA